MRDVRRTRGGRRLRGGAVKRVDGVSPQPRPVDHCSPGREGMAQDGGARGQTFHGEMDHCRENEGWTTTCSSICSNVTGRTKERIAQSERVRAGSLAITTGVVD